MARLFARIFEVQSTISFTASRAPDAARLTSSGGLCSATSEKAVRPREAKKTMLLTIETPRDFLSAGTELTHLGTLSPQLKQIRSVFVRIPLQFKQRDAMTN